MANVSTPGDYCIFKPDTIDEQVAKLLGYDEKTGSGDWTPEMVACIRSNYNAHHKTECPTDNSLETFNLLVNYRQSYERSKIQAISKAWTNISNAYKKLFEQFTAQEREDRINLISHTFSEIVDEIAEQNPTLNRKTIVNGFKLNGKQVCGESSIFIKVYNRLFKEFVLEEDPEVKKKFEKILNNWDVLCVAARSKLKETEGLILGGEISYADIADEDCYGENRLAEMFDASIESKEHWQDKSADNKSSFGSCGIETRRVLRNIVMINDSLVRNLNYNSDNEEFDIIDRDDLGYPRYLDPVQAHKIIVEVCQGCTNAEEMLATLARATKKYPWITSLYNMLQYISDEELSQYTPEQLHEYYKRGIIRAQFFKDCCKNKHSYLGTFATWTNNVLTFKRKILNRSEYELEKIVVQSIKRQFAISGNALFTDNGNIRVQALQNFHDLANKWFPSKDANKNTLSSQQATSNIFQQSTSTIYGSGKFDENNPFESTLYQKGLSTMQRAEMEEKLVREVIVPFCEMLNVSITVDNAYKLLYDKEKLRAFKTIITDINKHVITNGRVNSVSILNTEGKISDKISKFKFWSLYKYSPIRGSKKGVLEENIRKLVTKVVAPITEVEMQQESKCLWKNQKDKYVAFYSHVQSSYLGKTINKIQKFAEYEDWAGLKHWIEENYLKSSFFCERDKNGNLIKIYNKWLELLYNSDKDSTFAKSIAEARELGYADQSEVGNTFDFENFTEKTHMITMLQNYFAQRQISDYSEKSTNYNLAEYPTFILGDSGVSKYITSTRINDEEEIIDGLFNCFTQETIRMKQTKAMKEKLSSNSNNPYKMDSFLEASQNEYTILPFLNDYFNSYPEDRPENQSKEELNSIDYTDKIKNVIRTQIIETDLVNFKNRLKEFGLLETTDDGRYIYFDQEINGNKNKSLDDIIKDFYLNYKYAMIQQIQFMTIDTAYYGLFVNKEKTKVSGRIKSLQKRYKEVHAPGDALDITARDLTTHELYSIDGIERCLYFDDIDVNAELSDPAFMECIFREYAIASIEEINQAIKEGILIPKEKNSDEERTRVRKLQILLGTNYPLYKQYQKNTLTDGQGYRSLDSYRKVRGMAGQWNDECEIIYLKLKAFGQKYSSREDISEEDLKEINKCLVKFQPIKPYLYTIEHYSLNDNDDMLIPVQHKYAEAVLIPCLLPKNSKLRAMGKYMQDNNIDVIGSTKIVKVGSFGSVDISQTHNESDLAEALSKAYVHKLSYSDYKIQTNVPDHINSSQLFGTQIRKLIMAGVIKYDPVTHKLIEDEHYQEYIKDILNGEEGMVNVSGQMVKLNSHNLIAFYNELICANILTAYDKMLEAIKTDKLLSNKLIQNLIANSRESRDNIIAYSITEDEKFLMPLFEGGLEFDSMATILSIFRREVNKQKIKGGSAVQMSAMGIDGYEEDQNLKCTVIDNNIVNAEVEMPFNFSITDKNGDEYWLKYEDYCNSDGTFKLAPDGKTTLIEFRFPGILDFVSYRIPTERAYSMINCHIKRCSKSIEGGTIKVPAQFTTIAGFDFDIDKLYMMLKSFKLKDTIKEVEFDPATMELLESIFDKSKIVKELKNTLDFEEYDCSKPALENSISSRNNMILELIRQRLMDSETLRSRTTPGGFEKPKISARIFREFEFGDMSQFKDKNGNYHFSEEDFKTIEKRADDFESDPEPNYDYSDPITLVTYNQQNQVAGKLIGIFANQNTNHAFASLMNEFQVKNPIAFANHYNDGGLFDLLHAPKGVDIEESMASFLAASVDAVKDPVLNFLNFNVITADSGAFLARLGYTTTEIGFLFNQPIIKQLCQEAFNNNKNLDSAYNSLFYQYKSFFSESEWNTITDKNILLLPREGKASTESLAISLLQFRDDRTLLDLSEDKKIDEKAKDFIKQQLSYLALFKQISNTAKEVTEFVTATKFTASNSIGSTAGALYAQQSRVNKYLEDINTSSKLITIKVAEGVTKPLSNNYNLVDMDNSSYLKAISKNPLAYEQCMYDMNRRLIHNIIAKYYPYDTITYKKTRNLFASFTKNGILNENTINSIHSDLLVYMLSQAENSLFNPGFKIQASDNRIFTAREYYTKYFGADLQDILDTNPKLKEVEIFKVLSYDISDDTMTSSGQSILEGEDTFNGQVDWMVKSIAGLQSYQKDAIKESWAELIKMGYPKLARDLFMYNFYKTGFAFTSKSFMNLVPTAVKELLITDYKTNQTYPEFLKDIQNNNISIDTLRFAYQYILNHLDNYQFVYTPYKGKVANYFKKSKFNQNSFIIDLGNHETNNNPDRNEATVIESLRNQLIVRTETDDDNSKTYYFKPCIIIPDDNGNIHRVYMVKDGNTSNTPTKEYVAVDILGKTNVSMQYSSNFSVIKENNENKPSISEVLGSTEVEVTEITGTLEVEQSLPTSIINAINESIGLDLTQSSENEQLAEKIANDGNPTNIMTEDGSIVPSCEL